jgi:hypothetical protein
MKRLLALLSAGVLSLGLSTSASAQHSIAAGSLILTNSGGFTTTLTPGANTSNITLTLPTTLGTLGQTLALDGSGNFVWTTTTSGSSVGTIFAGTTSNNMDANTSVDYFNVSGPSVGNNHTESFDISEIRVPAACTAKNFYVDITAACGATKSRTFSIYNVTQSTHIDVTISGATATAGSNTANTLSFNAGDIIEVQQVAAGTPTNAQAAWSFQVQ